MQSTFGGAGTFADVLTSSYGLNLPEYGEATADGAPNNAPSSAASEAAAEAALAAEAGHGGGSEGGGHLITQLSAAQVKKDGYMYWAGPRLRELAPRGQRESGSGIHAT